MKKLLSMMLVLAMIFNSFIVFAQPASVFASASGIDVSISEDSTERNVKVTSSGAISDVSLYVAAYDGDGKMVGVVVRDNLDLVKGENAFEVEPTWASSDREYSKIFLWDNNNSPLTEQKTVYPPAIKVETVHADIADGTAKVDISIENNPGISSLKFDVTYDEELVLTGVEYNDNFGYVTAPEPFENPQTISFISPFGEVDLNETFATLVFDISGVSEGTECADIYVTCDAENTFDEENTPVVFDVVNGKIEFDNDASAQTASLMSLTDPITLSVTEKTAVIGKTVDVDIVLTGNTGLSSLKFKVEYDDILTLENVELNKALFGSLLATPFSYSNPQTISLVSPLKEVKANGTIATLTFNVSEEAQDGYEAAVNITYDTDDIFDGDYNNIATIVNNSIVTVYNGLPGDMNADGKVNNWDAILHFQYLADFGVVIDTNALDANGDEKVNNKDSVEIFRYVAGWSGIVLKRGKVCNHVLEKIDAVAATCTEPGNIEYWHCTADCGNFYSDVNAKNKIALEDTVVEVAEHTYYEDWSMDETYHWHAASCGCGEDVYADKTEHKLVNNICSVCGYDGRIKLSTPYISMVEYDVINWNSVDNAKYYTVIADSIYGSYSEKTTSTSYSIKALKNTDGENITEHCELSIRVYANQNGNYLESNESDAVKYYYVPESKDSATVGEMNGYKLGYGFNFVEEKYFDTKSILTTSSPVFNQAKLLSVGVYSNSGAGDGYSRTTKYSSADELISNIDLSTSVTAGGGVVVANVKTTTTSEMTAKITSYKYNQICEVEEAISFRDYYISSWDFDKIWEKCLSDQFLKDIRGVSDTTLGMSTEELAQYIYTTYGTHAIVGVITGGKYNAKYVVSTNNQGLFAKIKNTADVSGGGSVGIVDIDAGIKSTISSDTTINKNETESNLYVEWTGSTGGGTTTVEGLNSAISNFESKLNESSATTVAVTSGGAISIVSLIDDINPSLASELNKVIQENSNEEYEDLIEEFAYTGNTDSLPMSVSYEDAQWVLKIDLSKYQASGIFGEAYNANFVNNILTVHPTMSGKRIGKIIVEGDFDNTPNLIDKFSIALPKTWNRDVEVVIRNLGVVEASAYGLVDTTAIAKNIVTVSYEGINAIKDSDGNYQIRSDVNGVRYDFKFKPSEDNSETTEDEGETIVLADSGIYDGILRLPVAQKSGYNFRGWKASDETNAEPITDNNGFVKDGFIPQNDVTTLYADWQNATYKITLDDEDATTAGTKEIFQQFYVGVYKEYECENRIESITTPKKTGYEFCGYYAKVSNNNSVNATGETEYIDKNGNILLYKSEYACAAFTENVILYALWKPAVYKVTLYNENKTNVLGSFFTRYKDGFYGDENCTESVNLKLPDEKDGYTFGGYYDGNTQIVYADLTINDDAKEFTSNKDLTLKWVEGAYVITLNPGEYATTKGTTTYYEKVSGGYYSDSALTKPFDSNKITIPTRTGHKFGGYKNSNGTIIIDENGLIKQDVDKSCTLEAVWTAREYKITYNLNASSIKTTPSISQSSKTIIYGQSNNLDIATATYFYGFDGWYKHNNDGTTTMIADSNGAFTEEWKEKPCSITVHAHWKKSFPEYTYLNNDNFKSDIDLDGKNYLVSDIDLSKYGTLSSSFFGTLTKTGELDGQGFTISGLKINIPATSKTSNCYYGLFSENNGKITNLNISKSNIYMSSKHDGSGTVYAGIVCGTGSGTIGIFGYGVNVSNSAIEIHRSRSSYGLISGNFSGTITGCTVSNSSLYGNGDTGGVSGTASGTVVNCTASSLYIGYYATHNNKSIGGIVGYFSTGGTINSCNVTGTAFDYRGSDDDELDGDSLHDFNIFGGHHYCRLAPKMGYVVGHLQSCSASGNTASNNSKTFYAGGNSGQYNDSDKSTISGNSNEGQYYFKQADGKIGKLD